MAHGAMPDHHAVTAGVPLDTPNVGDAQHAAVAEHRDTDRLLDLGNRVPVRRVGIILRARSPVDGNERRAVVFQDVRYLQVIARLVVPA